MHPQTKADMRRASMLAHDDDVLLTTAQVKVRCGDVSDMCIWRWLRDERVGFPQPIKINRRNYWRLGDLRAWQERHGAQAAA